MILTDANRRLINACAAVVISAFYYLKYATSVPPMKPLSFSYRTCLQK